VPERSTEELSVMTDAPMVGSMPATAPSPGGATVFEVDDVSVFYGDFRAVRDVSMEVRQHQITTPGDERTENYVTGRFG
jgi:ABC-type uncharacterized transport system ATPase subunit